PKELRAEAEIAKLDAPTIIDRAGRLVDRLDKIAVPSDRLLAERHEWLRANLVSLRMQLEAKSGTKLPLREEVRLRYGFQPDFEPLSSYDPILARLDKQLPGSGSLSDRIARMRQATIVPADRVLAVQGAALAECRRRAAQHIRIR